MKAFPASFLLFLFQTALGGLFALAATPFQQLERGFYKSTAGVLFVLDLLAFWGKAHLYLQTSPAAAGFGVAAEMALHLFFLIFFGAYLISLWWDRPLFRARCFSLSLFTGLAGLILSASGFYQAPFWSLETLVYPLSFFLSALLLGGVTVGMLIGHWYLIDTGQSIEPFVRIFKFFFTFLVAQTIFFWVAILLLYFAGTPAVLAGLKLAWTHHLWLLLARIVISQAAPLILSLMIWRTLKIPHTMAATGLFYIALLGVFVGEILARQILALTSLPL
jgi:hypothetical protein